MSNAYLLAYDDEVGGRDDVKKYLNAIPEITHWRYDMPHCFYIISELSANELANKFRRLSKGGQFIVTEILDNSEGWLTPDSWYLIQHKTYKPKPKKKA